MDETYFRVAGEWAYLYRAIDSTGESIDILLSPRRDLIAAKLFLRLALSAHPGIRPRVINADGHPAAKIDEEGGPLLYGIDNEEQQRSFDSTCRKLHRFLSQPPG